MAIIFDPAKRDETLRKRGLDFGRCSEVFANDHLTYEDDRYDYGEQRYVTVGWLDERILIVVWTPRLGHKRIISMRKANEREQHIYGRRMARH